MKSKKHSILLLVIISALILIGLSLIGYGAGKLAGREYEAFSISFGLGLIIVAAIIFNYYTADDN